MNIDMSFWAYFLNADLVVKLVLLLLIGASILSWSFIMQRGFYLKDMRAACKKFEHKFWSSKDLAQIYTDSINNRLEAHGLESIFQAGFKEFSRLHKQWSASADGVMENVKRAMRAAQMREQDKMETQLPFLATVGSISPYVGLFGTVWGLMFSLRSLAQVQQATIAMVAPGISEALIATAMGLFAAIPAVIAYNRYATEIGRLLNSFDSFADEFANILYRQAQYHSAPAETERQ